MMTTRVKEDNKKEDDDNNNNKKIIKYHVYLFGITTSSQFK